MSTRIENFVEGEFYHVFNRGNSKQPIFLDDQDRDRFVKLLFICNSNKNVSFKEDIAQKRIDAFDHDRGSMLVSIGAWVIMPNHYHLLISPRACLGEQEKEGLSKFMNKLGTSYSMYFNKKYKRVGSLFEGKFKSVRTISDEQTKYNFSYIHLNPIKIIDSNWKERGLKDIEITKKFLDEYKWSSYFDYKNGKRQEGKIISPEAFPEYFSRKELFDDEIFSWLENERNIHD